MASEDAPNGRIIQAAGGRFASDAVFSNKGVSLGTEFSEQDFIDSADAILDLSAAQPKTTFWRDD